MRRAPRKVVFSEFYIKNLKPGPAPYLRWDAKQAGFAVRVEPSGYKAWKAIYKFGGRKRDTTSMPLQRLASPTRASWRAASCFRLPRVAIRRQSIAGARRWHIRRHCRPLPRIFQAEKQIVASGR